MGKRTLGKGDGAAMTRGERMKKDSRARGPLVVTISFVRDGETPWTSSLIYTLSVTTTLVRLDSVR